MTTSEQLQETHKRAQAAFEVMKKRPAKRTVVHQGIEVQIDRPIGYTQKGKDKTGKEWSRTFKNDYGYIRGTDGGDGEPLDVYLGPHSTAPNAYWVQQKNDGGAFDEFKLMLGFPDRRSAVAAYSLHTPMKYYSGTSTTSVAVVKALLGLQHHAMITKALVGFADPQPAVPAAKVAADVDVSNLPDDAFLYIEKGGKPDAEGKTAPRRLRHFPVRSEKGLHIGRIQEAVTKAGQAKIAGLTADERTKIEARAKELLAEVERGASPPPKDYDLLRIAKADPVQRYTLGIVLEPDVIDAQGETISAEDIRIAQINYMVHFRNVGLQHQQLVNGAVDLIDCWIAPEDTTIAGMAIKAGTWLAGHRWNDDDLWNGVVSGQITGLSIGGTTRKVDPVTGATILPEPEDRLFFPQ